MDLIRSFRKYLEMAEREIEHFRWRLIHGPLCLHESEVYARKIRKQSYTKPCDWEYSLRSTAGLVVRCGEQWLARTYDQNGES